MAEVIAMPVGKQKTKLRSVKIDMTPMVDLGFLLITFFIFNASLTGPTVTKLTMPKNDITAPPQLVQEKTLLTAIPDKDKVYVYEGAFEKAVAQNTISQSGYGVQSGLGEFIRQKQKKLGAEKLTDKLMVAIKPLPSASYQNVLNALDEMQINNVKRYGIIEISPAEKDHLSQRRIKR